jgi:hypothetical protein
MGKTVEQWEETTAISVYIMNGVLLFCGGCTLFRELFYGSRRSFLLVIIGLMCLSQLTDITFWIFKTPPYEKGTNHLDDWSYFIHTVAFNSTHWIFACQYWKVSKAMPSYVVSSRNARIPELGCLPYCIFYFVQVMNVGVPAVALYFSYTYPGNFGKFVTVDWVILFLLILSVLVLFDGLRRIWVTLRKWKENG